MEESQAIAASESEPCSVGTQRIGNRTRILVDATQRVADDVGNRSRVRLFIKEIRGDAGRTRDRQAAKDDPFPVAEPPVMEAHVGTPEIDAVGQA